jgi:hypothetical protein
MNPKGTSMTPAVMQDRKLETPDELTCAAPSLLEDRTKRPSIPAQEDGKRHTCREAAAPLEIESAAPTQPKDWAQDAERVPRIPPSHQPQNQHHLTQRASRLDAECT